jgi:thermitase
MVFIPLANQPSIIIANDSDETAPVAEEVTEPVFEEPAVETGPQVPEQEVLEEIIPGEIPDTIEPFTGQELVNPEQSIAIPESEKTDTLEEVETTIDIPLDPVSTEKDSSAESPVTVNPTYAIGQVVVSYDPAIPIEEQIARLNALGLEILSTSSELGVMIIKVPEGLELESVNALSVMDGIQYAEPVYIASAQDFIPNDPGYSNQENMNVINAPGGWQYFTGSSNVIIAIIDSGVDMSHPDLSGKILQGWDYVNGDNNAQDDYGHGTHVAGIAAAIGNNSTGVAGLDWSAKILPVKVLDNTGFGTAANIALGIRYAVDNGANIINLSLIVPFDSVLVSSAIEYAYQHGVTVIASTGNNNGAVNFPAAYPQVIAVGAVDNTETLWAQSNRGAEIDLVAPGVNIYSTDITSYSTRTGTSMAAAHVSGLAALLLGMTSMTPDQVKTSMQNTSKDLGTSGWDSFFGYGLIQVKDAILKLFNSLFPVVRRESNNIEPTIIFWPTFTPTPTPTMTPTPTPTITPVN